MKFGYGLEVFIMGISKNIKLAAKALVVSELMAIFYTGYGKS